MRSVFLDAVEEAPEQLVFRFSGFAQRPDAEAVAIAQGAGDRYHAMQVQRQEIAAGGRTPAVKCRLRHFRIAGLRTVAVQAAQPFDIRDCLDVKGQNGGHASRRHC